MWMSLVGLAEPEELVEQGAQGLLVAAPELPQALL